MGKIRSTSFSRLLDYESCPFKAYLKIVEKIPEPERPLPPGKTEHANDRGSRIHDEAEKFIRGERGEPPIEVMQYFKDEFYSLRNHFKKGMATLEGEWGFDKDWQPCDWRNAWLRVKLDANVRIDKTHSAVIDYKTGRRFGNEIKHGQQTQLYSLAVVLRDPTIQMVTTELWYPDVNDLARAQYTRLQALRLQAGFDRRFKKMTNATEFPATPNIESCKYCPYHPVRGSGHCKKGV